MKLSSADKRRLLPHHDGPVPTWVERLVAYQDDVIDMRSSGLSRDRILYIGRPTVWGNKFLITTEKDRLRVTERFLQHVMSMLREDDPDLEEWLLPVAIALANGKKLGCYCAPRLCHGMVLSGVVRNLPSFTTIFTKAGKLGT